MKTRARSVKSGKPAADLIVHNLDCVIRFPKPYCGKGTPVGWDIREEHHVSIAGLDGIIVWIGPSDRLSEEVTILPDCRFVEGEGLTALPGFVDSHTHLVYAGDRSDEFEMRVAGKSYLEIMAANGGIMRTVEAVREMDEEELFDEASERLMEAIEWGVTTIEIKSGYGLDLENELKMLNVVKMLQAEYPVRIVSTFMGAHAIPAQYAKKPETFVDMICREWIPQVAKYRLAEFNDAFCEKKAFTVEQTRRILMTGLEHGLKPKIHADEISVIGGVDLAVEVGAVSADHLICTEQKGIRKLVGSGVIPTLLPGTSTYLMEPHHAKAREMIKAGLPVAIASDHNPGSCQFLGAGMIQTLAMLQLRMTAGEALIAGTLHAAHALDLGDEIGAIEIGRRMDLALIVADSWRSVGYRAGQNQVHTVIANGTVIMTPDGFELE
ncbi:MAG TPA: imidazolonepropionase [Candidatus Ozemobacteraceae bacterium]|nr:imidazolonepropionase [Candidatus Ozemobacteraceae bacterium]